MPAHKTAVTLPQELLAEVDRVAADRGQSRSAFVVTVLRRAMRARRDADITRRLDELFRDEDLAAEQVRGARELDDAGSDWAGERW